MVSVIIPCFNSKPLLLDRCLTSIDRQTYSDVETIVVDDGSEKQSINSIQEIIDKHPGVRLIKAEHGGLSSARNIGVKSATGEYVTFVDYDDTVSEWMVENLVFSIKKSNADIALGYIVAETETEDYVFSNNAFDVTTLTHQDLEKLAFVGFSTKESNKGHLTCGPCGALYERNLVLNHLFDEELEIFEDVYWNVLTFRASNRVVSINQPVYAYRNVSGSITHTWKLSTISKRIKALKKIEDELLTNKVSKEWYAVRLLTNYTTIISCIMITDELNNKQDRIRYCKEISQNPIWALLSEDEIGKSWDYKNKAKLVLYRWNLIVPIYYWKYGRNLNR